MKVTTRAILALVLAAAALAAPAGAQRKAKSAVPGEEAFRSAAGYHAAVMEHCKQINKIARGTAAFNAPLAREHAGEVARNLDAAARHQASYSAALGAEQRSLAGADAATAEQKLGECRRLAAALAEALKAASPDRKHVAAAATDLFLAERDLVAAHKAAGKLLGITPASTPRKNPPTPPRRGKKAAAAEGEDVGAVARPARE